MNTAGAEVRRVQARTTCALVKDHQLFALFKTPQRRSQRTHIHRLRRDVQQMRENATNLGIQHPNDRSTIRHCDAHHLLDGQAVRMLLVHRRDVIKPIKIRQRLQIGLLLNQLFRATVQQANMRIDALNDFAVQLQHEAQNAVRRRVLWPEVDVEVTN